VSAIEIKGLDALWQRLEAMVDPRRFKEALRAGAEAIAADARREVPAELAQSIEVNDASRGTEPAYRVGSSNPLGRILEFGTLRRPPTPWLWPAFRARLPAVKDSLRKVLSAASKTK
jgi:HK97 gp10 family phage protein